MSADWNVLCDACKQFHHLGQDMGGICSFGYGSQDGKGRSIVGEFISEHLYHGRKGGGFLRVMHTDDLLGGYKNVEPVPCVRFANKKCRGCRNDFKPERDEQYCEDCRNNRQTIWKKQIAR